MHISSPQFNEPKNLLMLFNSKKVRSTFKLLRNMMYLAKKVFLLM